MSRVPIWELHVRPMFRLLDREHMRFAGDLWDYEFVRGHADAILGRVADASTPMPNFDTGGPWPEEWVGLFRRWVEAGFPRLQTAPAPADGYEVKQTFTGTRLSAWIAVPGEGFRVWLDIESVSDTERCYRLVQEPPAEVEGSATELEAVDKFESKTVRTLRIVDADGVHEIEVSA